MASPSAAYELSQLEPSAPTETSAPGQIVARARAEAEQIRARAYEEGLAAGHAAGMEEARASVESAIGALSQVQRDLLRARDERAEELERMAAELAVAIAEKVLAGTIAAKPEVVLDVIRGALRQLDERRSLTVLVNPADIEIVSAAIDELIAGAGGAASYELYAERRIGRGGAVVRTPEGELDASIDAQLERVREIVADELSQDRPAPSTRRRRQAR
jgi:flagellar assembly protein FliH